MLFVQRIDDINILDRREIFIIFDIVTLFHPLARAAIGGGEIGGRPEQKKRERGGSGSHCLAQQKRDEESRGRATTTQSVFCNANGDTE